MPTKINFNHCCLNMTLYNEHLLLNTHNGKDITFLLGSIEYHLGFIILSHQFGRTCSRYLVLSVAPKKSVILQDQISGHAT